jgi:hypothetical protein
MSDLTNHRTLTDIGNDLSHAIQNRTTGMLRIGQLLNEAKELAVHGEWLPFLKLHRIEGRSAQNYMKAATWADTKSETVSYFELSKIAPKAIYALAGGKFSDDVVEQVISAAQHRHIGIKDLESIAKVGTRASILREIRAELAEAETKAEAEKAEDSAETAQFVVDLNTVAGRGAVSQPNNAGAVADNTNTSTTEVPPSQDFGHAIKTLVSIIDEWKPDDFTKSNVSIPDITRAIKFLEEVLSDKIAAANSYDDGLADVVMEDAEPETVH